MRLIAAAAILFGVAPGLGSAATFDGNPGTYRARLSSLAPGDTLVLAPDTYTQGLPVDSRGASHHITLEHLKIINHGADQQIVGISTKGPA